MDLESHGKGDLIRVSISKLFLWCTFQKYNVFYMTYTEIYMCDVS